MHQPSLLLGNGPTGNLDQQTGEKVLSLFSAGQWLAQYVLPLRLSGLFTVPPCCSGCPRRSSACCFCWPQGARPSQHNRATAPGAWPPGSHQSAADRRGTGGQVAGQTIAADIQALYRQKGLQTRFWLEGVVLETAGDLLNKATAGLAAVALVSLSASLLVLSSVVTVSRRRQLYEANLLHCLGARHRTIQSAMLLETGLLTLISTLFASALGALIALPLAAMLLKLPAGDLCWLAALVAGAVSSLALLGGRLPTLRALRLYRAMLLREG